MTELHLLWRSGVGVAEANSKEEKRAKVWKIILRLADGYSLVNMGIWNQLMGLNENSRLFLFISQLQVAEQSHGKVAVCIIRGLVGRHAANIENPTLRIRGIIDRDALNDVTLEIPVSNPAA